MGYARNRWYDARNAVFLTEDPLDDIDSPNVYGFVAGRPHEFTDPEGLFSSLNAAKEGAKTLARNLAIIGGIGIVTGFCPPCGAALAIGATGYLAYGVQSDINDRLKQGQNGAQATAGAMGNLTGIGGITEGITNKDFVTGAELNLTDEEREKRVGQGAGNLLSWFAGPKVFKVGAKFGAGARVKFDAWRASENTWPSIKPEGGWEFDLGSAPAGPHQMTGRVVRGAEVLEEAEFTSGGSSGRKNWQEQQGLHTERKFLQRAEVLVEPGVSLEMEGSLDPCRSGCARAIRDFVDVYDSTAKYKASSTGREFRWTPRAPGRLMGTVLQEQFQDGQLVGRWRYWRTPAGRWRRAPVPF